jgi:hypothetical protein
MATKQVMEPLKLAVWRNITLYLPFMATRASGVKTVVSQEFNSRPNRFFDSVLIPIHYLPRFARLEE